MPDYSTIYIKNAAASHVKFTEKPGEKNTNYIEDYVCNSNKLC